MKFLKRIWKYIVKFKYIIVIVLGLAIVVFLDENSFLARFKYNIQISQLKDQIADLEAIFERDSIRLSELDRNPEALIKIARERYFMKADDEDIFVLSDDQTEQGPIYEAIE